MMRDVSIGAICEVFGILEPNPPACARLDEWGSQYPSQKAHVLSWFASQGTTGGGAYSRSKGNDSARACYNRLLNPGMLIWIAAALGANEAIIDQATAAARAAERQNYRKRCGAFRAVLPFDDVARLLDDPSGWALDRDMLSCYTIGADNMPRMVEGMEATYEELLTKEFGID